MCVVLIRAAQQDLPRTPAPPQVVLGTRSTLRTDWSLELQVQGSSRTVSNRRAWESLLFGVLAVLPVDGELERLVDGTDSHLLEIVIVLVLQPGKEGDSAG